MYRSYLWIKNNGSLNLAKIFLFAFLGIWMTEGILQSYKRIKDVHYENHFLNPSIPEELRQLSLDKYQAIYTIPPSQAWNCLLYTSPSPRD